MSASEITTKQPQPIVLDPSLKLSSNCKLVKNYLNGVGQQPWLIASEKDYIEKIDKRSELENAGVKIIPIKGSENG